LGQSYDQDRRGNCFAFFDLDSFVGEEVVGFAMNSFGRPFSKAKSF
jgi:hypothetical protein